MIAAAELDPVENNFKVRAVSASGDGDSSPVVTFNEQEFVGTPDNLRMTDEKMTSATDVTINLNWDQPTFDAFNPIVS
jgi:hypothetical protein